MNLFKNKKISDLIQITLIYNNKEASFFIKNFTKLKKVKEKAYQLFFPINTDIKLKYNNRDFSYFLDQSIGLLFENKEKIKFKIEPILGTRKLIKNNKLNSSKNIYSSIAEISKQPLSADRYHSIQTESVNKIKYKVKLPSIKNNYSEIYLANEFKLGILSYKNCKDCLRNNSNYYCRNCDSFVCSNCSNKIHKNHLTFEISLDNEKINIEKYKTELLKKFSSSINNLNILDNVSKKEISVEDWKLKYNKAINNLTQKAFKQFEKNKNIQKIEENKEDDNNKELKKKIKEEKNNINKIVISVNKDPFKLFKEINDKEKSVRQLIKQANKENNSIDDMFFIIDNEIDNIIYDLEEKIFSK